jgi:hypothetical protein
VSASFLPYLALMTANSEPCKSGEFPVNHFAIVEDSTRIDLGSNVDVVVLAWRSKAIKFAEPVISSFDRLSEVYKSLVDLAEQPNSNTMHGPEFLLWVPAVEKYATMHFGSKSARREAWSMQARLHAAATLIPKKCETPKFTWFIPHAEECNSIQDLAEPPELSATIQSFLNPPAPEAPEVAENTSGRER